MTNLVQKVAVKSAVRKLVAPVADLTTFTALVQESWITIQGDVPPMSLPECEDADSCPGIIFQT